MLLQAVLLHAGKTSALSCACTTRLKHDSNTKCTETLGMHTCIRGRVPRKGFAVGDTIHPPPSCARYPRDLAPVTLHAGKTSALSLDTELGNAHTWNHWHQEDVCDTIHPPPSWRAARCPREAENSGQDWACKLAGLVGRSSCAPTSCAPACWKDVRLEL